MKMMFHSFVECKCGEKMTVDTDPRVGPMGRSRLLTCNNSKCEFYKNVWEFDLLTGKGKML
jgi:hypothetical protein